jgi:hypothetical protein
MIYLILFCIIVFIFISIFKISTIIFDFLLFFLLGICLYTPTTKEKER